MIPVAGPGSPMAVALKKMLLLQQSHQGKTLVFERHCVRPSCVRVYVPRRLVTTISVHASSPISTTQLSRHVVSNGVLVWHTPSHSLSDSAACASFFGDKLDIIMMIIILLN